MSLTIIKAGLLDTIQDEGRAGFRDLGINIGGVMDVFSARLANALLGKAMNSAVLEMHFPAPVISFGEVAVICLAGANFTACIQDREIPLNQPLVVHKGAVLRFQLAKWGSRCYLALLNNYTFPQWLGSYSTNIKASAGGLHGAALKKGDVLPFENIQGLGKKIADESFIGLPWYAQPPGLPEENPIEVVKGPEWDWLDESSKNAFLKEPFRITKVADRMGYKLEGKELQTKEEKELISSAVTFGTVQLLSSGQLIVLMADHQTTGGYPRVAHIISAHLPLLAQSAPEDFLTFRMTDIEAAEQKIREQYDYLQQIQSAAHYKIEKLLA